MTRVSGLGQPECWDDSSGLITGRALLLSWQHREAPSTWHWSSSLSGKYPSPTVSWNLLELQISPAWIFLLFLLPNEVNPCSLLPCMLRPAEKEPCKGFWTPFQAIWSPGRLWGQSGGPVSGPALTPGSHPRLPFLRNKPWPRHFIMRFKLFPRTSKGGNETVFSFSCGHNKIAVGGGGVILR